MNRFFLEVQYKGTRYAGFQKQENANTVQSEVERAFKIYFKTSVELTGSSRTDSGVHAFQNFFHFDTEQIISPAILYNINSLLPSDISVTRIFPVGKNIHCRFDAISRSYEYRLYHRKNPFFYGYAYYYPYHLDFDDLLQAAMIVSRQQDFVAFSKRNTQVRHFECNILESSWEQRKELLVYKVKANRFLRGMVRGLTGTMLQVARKKMTMKAFEEVFVKADNQLVDFSVPGHGLYLMEVEYPAEVVNSIAAR